MESKEEKPSMTHDSADERSLSSYSPTNVICRDFLQS